MTKEKHKLQERRIHKDLWHSDLSLMKARYDLDHQKSIAETLIGEKRTCEEVKQRIADLFNTTDKQGAVLHYIGPGQKETGNWCFKDGFISFQEIMKLYTQHFKPRGRVLTIASDSSYSGCWVKEAMTFMDGQGVGPCGHQAKEKGILVKVTASCLANEVPAELAFSTNCAANTDIGTVGYKSIQLRGEAIHEDQHPSGQDFTQVRCNNKIDQPCTMALQSTWQQWSDEQRIYLIRGEDKDRLGWHYVLIEDDEDNIKTFFTKLKKGSVNVSDHGQPLKCGWGKDASEKTKKTLRDKYNVNYNYKPLHD